jgi:division protein 1
MPAENKPPPIIHKRSEVRSTTTTAIASTNQHSTAGYAASTHAVVQAAKDKASSVVHSARDWLTPSTEWTSSFTQLESLSTVMFSPLAAHPVYKSESMVKAIQLMQQQQHRQQSSAASSTSTMLTAPRGDLVLHGKTYAWPSSTVLLQADIPETNNPVSLFQGFASAYPSLAKPSRSPKRARQKKKKQPSDNPKSKGISVVATLKTHLLTRPV